LKLVADRLTVNPGGTCLVRYSPDGKTLAALGEDGVLKVVDVPGFTVRAALPAVPGPAADLAYSKEGTVLAVVASEKVYVDNAATGKTQVTLPFQRPVAVAFAPDGKRLAVAVQKPGAAQGEVSFWNVETRAQDGEPIRLPGEVRDVGWSADGAALAVAAGKEVRLYDAASRQERRSIAAHTAPISGLAFAPDGRSLVTVGGDQLVKRWSVADGKLLGAYEGHTNPAGRPEFTPDGARLATFGGLDDGTVRLWDTDTGKPLGMLVNAPSETADLSFNRDGRTLAMALRHSPVRFWDTRGVEQAARAVPPHGKSTRPDEAVRFEVAIAIQMVRFSPDGKTLAASGREGDLLLLDVADWRLVTSKNSGRRAAGLTFAYGGDGRLVTASGGGGSARVALRNGVSGALLGDFPAGDGWVRSVAVSPDGKLVAVGFSSAPPPRFGQPPRVGPTGFVRLWDVSSEPKLLGTLEKLPSPAAGNVVYLRDGPTGNLRACLRPEALDQDPFGRLVHIALSPDGDLLALALTMRKDNQVIVWDVREGRPRGVVHPPSGPNWLDFSPDGKTLAAALSFEGVALYDPRELKEGKIVGRDKGGVKALAFSPDGKWLVAAPLSAKNGLVLVDAADGKLRAEVTRLPMPNSDPSFSPDGKYLAVVRKAPGQVVVYEVDRLLTPPP
jgi:WD40 repeat protein